jgi:hypothetical protein
MKTSPNPQEVLPAMNQKNFNATAGMIFLVVALAHALRLAKGWPMTLGPWSAPIWASWAAVLVAGTLAGVAFRLKR